MCHNFTSIALLISFQGIDAVAVAYVYETRVVQYSFHLTKDFQETPYADSTQDGNGKIVIPLENVNNFAGCGGKAGPSAHDSKRHTTGDGGLRVSQTHCIGETVRQTQGSCEHEALVSGHRPNLGNEPSPEAPSRHNTGEERSCGSSQRLALSNAGRVSSIEPSKRAGCGVAPTEEQNTHDTNVFGKAVENNPGAQQIKYDAVPAIELALAHESTQDLDVEPVERIVGMADVFNSGDRYQGAHEPGADGSSLRAGSIKPNDEKANRGVQ